MASARHNRKRRRNRGRLGLLFKLLCLAALAAAVIFGATVFFQVETIAVSGKHRYHRGGDHHRLRGCRSGITCSA